MQPIQISTIPDTWRIEDGFVRCFLLIGQEKALLIDSGASSPEACSIARSLTDLPLELLNTHGDGDHIAGNGCFPEFYIHPADYRNCHVAERFPESRCLPLADGDTLDLGGRPLEILAIPGHTLGSVAILDRNNRALFVGDSVQSGNIFLFGPHRAPEQFREGLEILLRRQDRFDVLYPAHDTPELPARYVQTVLDAWDAVQAGTVPGTKQDLFRRTVTWYQAEGCGFYCE